MRFPSCGHKPLGLYPIVDRARKLEALFACGVTTAQLRVKDLQGDALHQEIHDAVAISERYGARLFINDYWELALHFGAYGVHLGQEDIQTADMETLRQSGVRLGISTHNPSEIDTALAFEPSYVAMGPVFEPISKKLTYPPIGIETLQKWAKRVHYPVVAIGGITLDNIAPIAKTKAVDGIAMISAVLNERGEVSTQRTQALLEAIRPYGL